MSETPTPPPEGEPYYRGLNCPRCGAPNKNTNTHCLNCGARLKPQGTSWKEIVFPIVFVLIGLPALCLGVCLTAISFGSGPSAIWTTLFGLLLIAVFVLTLLSLFRMKK